MKIKNKFWLTACFLALSLSVKADDRLLKHRNHVHFMLFGGFNTSHLITDFDNSEIIISEAKRYYNLGAAFRFEFARFFYLQPEVYLTRKGGLEKIFRTTPSDSFDQRVDIQSIDMPIMLGLRFFHSNSFVLRAYGGPVVSFLQDPQVKIYKNGQIIPWNDIKTSTHVFSMQVGAGVDITRRFTFDVRYEYAFSPLLSISDFRTSHKILYFSFGLKLF